MRSAERRAAGAWYQHSFISCDITRNTCNNNKPAPVLMWIMHSKCAIHYFLLNIFLQRDQPLVPVKRLGSLLAYSEFRLLELCIWTPYVMQATTYISLSKQTCAMTRDRWKLAVCKWQQIWRGNRWKIDCRHMSNGITTSLLCHLLAMSGRRRSIATTRFISSCVGSAGTMS